MRLVSLFKFDSLIATESTYRHEKELGDREKQILGLVVRSFIDKAGPVGSRSLALKYGLRLSPATVRNTMSDLELLGYLRQPYTSAGRMPTQLGYRAFVDGLGDAKELSYLEKKLLKAKLDRLMSDKDDLFDASSQLLSRMSNLLAVVLSPKLSTGVLERLDVVPLSSPNVMIVISVRSRMVKTIIYETAVDVKRRDLDRIVSILNERLSGLRLDEIRRSYASRTRDIDDDSTGIVQLILNESATLFGETEEGRVNHSGTQQLLTQPEFQQAQNVQQLIKVIEDKGFVVRLFEQTQSVPESSVGQAVVSIGSELQDESTSGYSTVTARYQIGESTGMVGLLGPMRMDYERAIVLVETMASLLSRPAVGLMQSQIKSHG